jgi:hypothetical protein
MKDGGAAQSELETVTKREPPTDRRTRKTARARGGVHGSSSSSKDPMRNDEWAGLLASGSVYRPHLPALRTPATIAGINFAVVFLQLSSPVTAAGPQRIYTVFPILPPERRVPSDTHVAGHPSIGSRNVNEPVPAGWVNVVAEVPMA